MPPLCRPNTGLTPVDYFGRTLTEALPDSIRIGVIPVAMGYPAGWLVCCIATVIYYRFAHWEKHRIVE